MLQRSDHAMQQYLLQPLMLLHCQRLFVQLDLPLCRPRVTRQTYARVVQHTHVSYDMHTCHTAYTPCELS